MNESAKPSKYLTFLPTEKKVLARPDKTILDLALECGISLNHSCGGGGSCGTCLVEIQAGSPPPRNLIEKEMASERGFEDHERLGCQTMAIAGLEVRVPVIDDF